MKSNSRFKLWLAPELRAANGSVWLQSAIAQIDVSPARPRQYFKLALPESLSSEASGQAWAKAVAASRHRFEPWSRWNILPRLRPRFAHQEGVAYRALSAAGIRLPKLYAYGEEWRFGLRGRGIVIVEWLPLPTLQTQLESGNQEANVWAARWFELLAKIHSAGWVHGDADSDNFLLSGDLLITIDLEKSQPLTAKLQQKDLARAQRCLAESGFSAAQQQAAMAAYSKAAI